MCNNNDYNKCMKCGRYQIDLTVGHRNAPTESVVTCVFGGAKKWIWKHTEKGIEFELVK